jgi:large repetitive protein
MQFIQRRRSASRALYVHKSIRRLRSAVAQVEMLESRRLLSAVVQFSAPTSVPLGVGLGTPFAVASAEVNGDGNPYVAVANSNGTVSILFGNGNGGFTSTVTVPDDLPVGAGTPQDMVISANGEQIFVTNPEDGGLISILNDNGDGSFFVASKCRMAPAGSYVTALATGELFEPLLIAADSKGQVNIVVTNEAGTGGYLGAYYSVTQGIPDALAVGQTLAENGVSFPDVFVQTKSGQVDRLFLGDIGSRVSVVTNSNASPATSIAVADVNGDGFDDLVVGQKNGDLAEYLGNANYSMTPGPTVTGGAADSTFGVGVRLGDIQGYGSADALFVDYAASGGTAQPLSDGYGGAQTPDGPSFYVNAPLALADLNGDGKADLVGGYFNASTNVTGVRVQLNDTPSAAAFASSNTAMFANGFPGTFTVETRGFPASSLTETGALPGGVTFHGNGDGTATISGTPDSTGIFNVTLAANNPLFGQISQSFTLEVVAATPPLFVTAASTSFVARESGSFAIGTAGFPYPVITESGALPLGVSLVSNGNRGALLTGSPAAGTQGVYDITLTASNGLGNPISQSFVLTVAAATTITSANSTSFIAGQGGSFTFTTAGMPVGTLSNLSALPAGVTFVNNGDGTATLSGTPAAGTGGVYPLMITATNGVGSEATQNFNLYVDQAPSITSAAGASLKAGSNGTFTVTTSGYPYPAITRSGALPSGMVFTDYRNGTAGITGTPAVGTGGTYNITITAASNGMGSKATQSFVLTVIGSPFTSSASATFDVGTSSTFMFTTAGQSLWTLTTASALPAGVTFASNGDGTATLSGSPAAGTQGAYPLSITATNAAGTTATQNFTLNVGAAPTFTSASSATFADNANSSFTVTTAGFPYPAISETGALPAGVTLVDNGNGTATLSGTAGVGAGGSYPITISASNAAGDAVTQSFTLNVYEPVVFSGGTQVNFATGDVDSFTVTSLLVPTPSFTESGTLPSGLHFVDNGNGTLTLTGTPPTGAAGVYTLGVTASNTAGSSSENIVVTIGTPQVPAFTSAAAGTFTVGSAGTFQISATGYSVPVLAETGALPGGLTYTSLGNGAATISGTPIAGSGGVYTVTLTAANAAGAPTTQAFTLTVLEGANFTSSGSGALTAGVAGSTAIHVAGYPAPTITESGALPAGVTFVSMGNGNAIFTGTPAAGTGGAYVVTITASNAAGGSNTTVSQKYTLDVMQAPAFTGATSATISAGATGKPIVIGTTGFPAAALVESGALPQGVTFRDNGNGTGQFLGTPGAYAGGVYVVKITAQNSTSSITEAFTLTVNSAVGITSANTTTFTAGEAGSFTITTVGYPVKSLLASPLPKGLKLTNNGNGTGTLSGTVAKAGTYTFTIAVNNAGSASLQTFKLVVS